MLSNFSLFTYLFVKICKKSLFSSKLFSDISSECQTIWIPDEAPLFVGPHLDQKCLQRSSTVYKKIIAIAGKELNYVICCTTLRLMSQCKRIFCDIFVTSRSIKFKLSSSFEGVRRTQKQNFKLVRK